jgi:hypothetical protein
MSYNFKTFHTSLDCTKDFRIALQKILGTTLEILGATLQYLLHLIFAHCSEFIYYVAIN